MQTKVLYKVIRKGKTTIRRKKYKNNTITISTSDSKLT